MMSHVKARQGSNSGMASHGHVGECSLMCPAGMSNCSCWRAVHCAQLRPAGWVHRCPRARPDLPIGFCLLEKSQGIALNAGLGQHVPSQAIALSQCRCCQGSQAVIGGIADAAAAGRPARDGAAATLGCMMSCIQLRDGWVSVSVALGGRAGSPATPAALEAVHHEQTALMMVWILRLRNATAVGRVLSLLDRVDGLIGMLMGK